MLGANRAKDQGDPMEEGGPRGNHPSTPILDLDEFIIWCEAELESLYVLSPETRFADDLGFDNFQLFELVLSLHKLIGDHNRVRREIFQDLGSVRELHLHYLMTCSMPYE